MFIPPYTNLDEREPWSNQFYNDLVTYLTSFLSNINGTEMAAPLVLSRTTQNLDGYGHSIYNFRKWLGYGSADVCIRDVTGYGAKGDGSTDDLTAIQGCVDDLPISGGLIVMPPGIYMMSGTLNLAGNTGTKTNAVLLGCGEATRIRRAANSGNWPLLRMGGISGATSGQTLMGIGLDGNKLNQGTAPLQTNLDLDLTTSARIINCSIFDSAGTGISVGGATDPMVDRCRFADCVGSAVGHAISGRTVTGLRLLRSSLTGGTAAAVRLGPASDCIIWAWISGCAADGILIESVGSQSASSITIAHSAIQSCGGSGIHIYNEGVGSSILDIILHGNHCQSNYADGIRFAARSGAKIRRFVVTGNHCYKNAENGIGISGPISHGTIGTNDCVNNATSGILVDGTSTTEPAELISVCGNPCIGDCAAFPQNYGIHLTDRTKDLTVTGNPVNGNVTTQILDEGSDNDVAHNPGA